MSAEKRQTIGSALALALWVAASFAAAAPGALFPPGEWYASLRKPSWSPPNQVFGPVWTALYTMMGLAAWLVWRRGGFSVQRGPLGLFAVQLALNAMWTPLFFGLRQPGLALLDLGLLWGVLLATTVAFWNVQRAAGMLLAPYLAWVTFAGVLNYNLWRLNG